MINIRCSQLPELLASRAARPGNPARLSRALAEDTDQLNLPTKRPHVPLRREGNRRIKHEVSRRAKGSG